MKLIFPLFPLGFLFLLIKDSNARPSAYLPFLYLSSCMQIAIEFPYVLAQTLIYCIIFYSMASFEWTFERFTWYTFFMYFTVLYFTFYGMMTTAITPNHNVAAIIGAPFYMLWNLFSGLMIPHKVMDLFSFPPFVS